MPTYQYACTVCGHQLEAVQAFSDAPLTTCPECNGHLRKVYSSVGIVFKGSGFYRTDSRASSGNGGGSDGSGTSKPASSSSSDSSASSTSSSSSSSTSSSSTKPAASVAS